MNRRSVLAAAAALLLAGPALAQSAPVPPAAPAPAADTVRVLLQTAEGPITVELYRDKAPVTVANFLRYVDQKRFDGTSFYRAARAEGAPPDYGLVQFGVRNNPKKLLPPIAHESTGKTGLSHLSGTLSMARSKPGSAAGDIFIVVGDMVSLDADPKAPGDNIGFAAFGRVVDGMDIVKRILAAPISPTAGDGAFKGQILAKPVVISTARRIP